MRDDFEILHVPRHEHEKNGKGKGQKEIQKNSQAKAKCERENRKKKNESGKRQSAEAGKLLIRKMQKKEALTSSRWKKNHVCEHSASSKGIFFMHKKSLFLSLRFNWELKS